MYCIPHLYNIWKIYIYVYAQRKSAHTIHECKLNPTTTARTMNRNRCSVSMLLPIYDGIFWWYERQSFVVVDTHNILSIDVVLSCAFLPRYNLRIYSTIHIENNKIHTEHTQRATFSICASSSFGSIIRVREIFISFFFLSTTLKINGNYTYKHRSLNRILNTSQTKTRPKTIDYIHLKYIILVKKK